MLEPGAKINARDWSRFSQRTGLAISVHSLAAQQQQQEQQQRPRQEQQPQQQSKGKGAEVTVAEVAEGGEYEE